MLKHPYLLSFCILGAALGAMTYITRHPELWLERAHEAELRAACERMDKALEKSVIEFECQYQDKSNDDATFGEIMTFKDSLKIERNGDRKRVTIGKKLKSREDPSAILFNNAKVQTTSNGNKYVFNLQNVIGAIPAPIPFFTSDTTPYDYEILNEMVDVDGRPCVVVRMYEINRGNYSKFYLDPSIGYMPRKKNTTRGDSRSTCHFDDYREIAKNVFLPFSYRTVAKSSNFSGGFHYNGNYELSCGVEGPGETKILKVDVNPEFKEDDFVIHPELDTAQMKDWYFEEIKNTYKAMTGIMTFNL